MNTYQVTWYPPNAATASVANVSALDFVIDNEMVVFFDAVNNKVFAIARNLNPVVDRTANS